MRELKPEWVQWWRDLLHCLKDGAVQVQPGPGVAFMIDKEKRIARVIWSRPDYDGSETKMLNERCLAALGYTVKYGKEDKQ
jgi:hypothetical protein